VDGEAAIKRMREQFRDTQMKLINEELGIAFSEDTSLVPIGK